ncbi:MAG: bifunctional nuclease family protein [Gemmatimonadota bacterium]|nr:bifunctional nuclease family protein [Gemmatimonadota bacterium]
MREVTVTSLGLDKTSSTPVVILREKDGERMLPIWIGAGEASAIAMELAGVHFARPLTHDLFTAVVRGLGSSLVRVLITKVVENTYYASLVFNRDGEFISIDSRPSDSIALALRAEAPIYADESLLEVSALDVEEGSFDSEEHEVHGEGATVADVPLSELDSIDEPLREYLKKLDPQDFGRFEP